MQTEIIVQEEEVCPKVVGAMNLITHHDFQFKKDPFNDHNEHKYGHQNHTWPEKFKKMEESFALSLKRPFMDMLQVKKLFFLLIFQISYMSIKVVSAPMPTTASTTGISPAPVAQLIAFALRKNDCWEDLDRILLLPILAQTEEKSGAARIYV